jgi:hypothetical protein
MYAKIVRREEVNDRVEGANRLVYIPMKAVMNIVREERCCVKCVVEAIRG